MLVIPNSLGGGHVFVCCCFHFFRTRYVRYLMAFWCLFFMRVLILGFGNLRLACLLMECLCTTPFTPSVILMRGLVFHPLFYMVLISGSYLVCYV